MIHRALLYVMMRRLKNSFLRLRKRPGRLITTVVLIGVFVSFLAFGPSSTDAPSAQRLGILIALLALYLVLALFAGLGEPGPLFPPEDIDFILTAPFKRRHLLAYHLVRHYLHMALLGLFYAIFLNAGVLPNPWMAYVGIVLCMIIATHVQTAMTLLTATVSEHVFGRLRLASRVALVGVLVVAAVLAIAGLAGAGNIAVALSRFFYSEVARVIFYPAVAVGDLALATDVVAALPPLLGLLGLAAATFGVVLLFPVNFVETAVTRVERKQRLTQNAVKRAADTHAGPPWLSGAASVAWLNALTLRRRLRMIVGVALMMVFVMIFAGVRSAQRGSGDMPPILYLLAFFPLLAHLPLGFKGHREHLEAFKTLPLRPTRLAMAEVAVPTIALWVLQMAILGVLVVAGRLDAFWWGAGAVGYLVLDVGVVALGDVFQLGRDPRRLGFFVITLQMMTMMASVVPAAVAGVFVWSLTDALWVGLAAGVVVHMGVCLLLLYVLGCRFVRWEPTEGP